jgi:hypothetical protein
MDEVYQCRQEKINELIEVGKNSSDCQRGNMTIHQKIELSEQPCYHESHESTIVSAHFVIVLCVLFILLIAFLLSIAKIYQLSKDNKFLNAKLDKLCEDHVYEKVDYNLTESPKA